MTDVEAMLEQVFKYERDSFLDVPSHNLEKLFRGSEMLAAKQEVERMSQVAK